MVMSVLLCIQGSVVMSVWCVRLWWYECIVCVMSADLWW